MGEQEANGGGNNGPAYFVIFVPNDIGHGQVTEGLARIVVALFKHQMVVGKQARQAAEVKSAIAPLQLNEVDVACLVFAQYGGARGIEGVEVVAHYPFTEFVGPLLLDLRIGEINAQGVFIGIGRILWGKGQPEQALGANMQRVGKITIVIAGSNEHVITLFNKLQQFFGIQFIRLKAFVNDDVVAALPLAVVQDVVDGVLRSNYIPGRKYIFQIVKEYVAAIGYLVPFAEGGVPVNRLGHYQLYENEQAQSNGQKENEFAVPFKHVVVLVYP